MRYFSDMRRRTVPPNKTVRGTPCSKPLCDVPALFLQQSRLDISGPPYGSQVIVPWRTGCPYFDRFRTSLRHTKPASFLFELSLATLNISNPHWQSVPSSCGNIVPELHAALQSQGFKKVLRFCRTKKIDRPEASRGCYRCQSFDIPNRDAS
jgi:hypothetical protein